MFRLNIQVLLIYFIYYEKTMRFYKLQSILSEGIVSSVILPFLFFFFRLDNL